MFSGQKTYFPPQKKANPMQQLKLNPDFRLLVHPPRNRSYLVSPQKLEAVLNEDAAKILENPNNLPSSAAIDAFVLDAIRRRWLVDAEEGALANRVAAFQTVNHAHHLRRIQLELSRHCNLRCSHCYCEASPSESFGLSKETVFQLIEEAREMGVLFLDITGGEPLLRPDLFEILEFARKNKMILSLFSNATAVTAETASRLKEAGVATIQTSLDGIRPETHDRLRGRPGAFEKAVRGIRVLKQAGLRVSITVCVHRQNKEEIPALTRFISDDLGVPFRLDRVIPAGRALEGEKIALSNEEFFDFIRQNFPASATESMGKICDGAILGAEADFLEPHCGVGSSFLFIHCDGAVSLCPTLTRRENPEFEVGNIHKTSLQALWLDSPVLKKHRRLQCNQIQACPASRLCRGGCRSNAYLLHGKIDSPDEMNCKLNGRHPC